MLTNNDKLVLDQAILRHKEKDDRTKRQTPIPKGDGWVIRGSLFDCNRKSFERALRNYSDRLYLGWNPMKREGRGCWEVWHRPTLKTATVVYNVSGIIIAKTDYKPNDFEHWVADLEFLNMSFIKRLREMDAWENKQLVSGHDDQHQDFMDKMEREESEHLKYVVKHNKQAFRDLLDYTQQGYNPLEFFKGSK